LQNNKSYTKVTPVTYGAVPEAASGEGGRN
jgi:hypothetical protein